MIILYAFIDQDQHQKLINKYGSIFTDSFKTKILKYKKWQDAQLSLLGRVLLKYGLEHYYNISTFEIGLSVENKPFLINQDIHFNIAHAKNLVVCCIADFSIGIDVEYIDYNINVESFNAQMTENEYFQINNSIDKYTDFFTMWTQKEAILKADGRGLLIPLTSFEIVENQAQLQHKRYYLTKICISTMYKCYIAINKPIDQKEIQLEQINIELLQY